MRKYWVSWGRDELDYNHTVIYANNKREAKSIARKYFGNPIVFHNVESYDDYKV